VLSLEARPNSFCVLPRLALAGERTATLTVLAWLLFKGLRFKGRVIMFSSLEMFKKTEQDKDADARYKAQREEIDKAFKTIDEQWLSGKIVLNDLIWVLADGKQKDLDAYILPIIQSVINSKLLTIWNESTSVKLNDKAIHTKELPHKAFVLKKDFIHWWQQTQAVPFPQRLIDLATIATTKTSESTSELKPLQELIIKTLIKLKYDLMALPEGNGKTTGAKADTWKEICSNFENKGSFIYHWRYLRENNHIANKE
jgi:hypothetical protein